jgi:hypothetical protein
MAITDTTTTLAVLNPVAEQDTRTYPPAARSASLAGITLGLAWNGKTGGDVALASMAEYLGQRYEGIQLVQLYDDIPFGEETIELGIARCQAVVAATGD